MRLPSENTVEAYVGLRRERARCMCDRTRRERRYYLFKLQWIHMAASTSTLQSGAYYLVALVRF